MLIIKFIVLLLKICLIIQSFNDFMKRKRGFCSILNEFQILKDNIVDLLFYVFCFVSKSISKFNEPFNESLRNLHLKKVQNP